MPNQEAIIEFRKIHRAVLGKELTYKEANLKAQELLDLYRAVYYPYSIRKEGVKSVKSLIKNTKGVY